MSGILNLGALALVPSVLVVMWFELDGHLLASPWWMLSIGVPAGFVLLTISTFVMSRKGLRFAGRQLLVTVLAPFKYRLPALTVVRAGVAATGEELLFRLLGLWLLGSGPTGIAVTTVAFAAAHLTIAKPGRRIRTILDATLCGVVLAMVYLLSGGIAAAMLAHFLHNLALDALRAGKSQLASVKTEKEQVQGKNLERGDA